MSRTNSIYCALLALILLACGARAEDMLIKPEDIVKDAANYKTATVELGEYIKKVNVSATEYYPTQFAVKYTGAGARYVETVVKRGSVVKQGDLIAVFEIDRDEVRVAQARLNLQRAKEAYIEECEAWEERLEDKRKAQIAATDTYAAEIMRIEHRQMQLSYELYRYGRERAIKQQTEALDELLESYEHTEIYAPNDGVVFDVTYIRSGQMVYDGAVIARIYDPYDLLFFVEDNAGAFRYNMPVTVSVGAAKSRVTGTGRVVASYNALPGEASGNGVYVRVTEYDADEVTTLTRPTVEANTVYLGNVMLVNRAAVSLYGGRYSVYKLVDGQMVSKRYVTYAAGNTATGAWLTQGVEPGEVLILD